MTARGGRRPGASGTREAILAAARARFGERGYRGATIRGIAGDAGVDPALVHHYFGAKRALFRASLTLPFRPAEVVARLLAGDPEHLGEQLVTVFVEAWDHAPDMTPMMALLRSAVADEDAAAMAREFIAEVILEPVSAQLAVDDAPLRAVLTASQIVGLAMARYIVRVEPLASAEPAVVAAAVGPTIQRYLRGPLA